LFSAPICFCAKTDHHAQHDGIDKVEAAALSRLRPKEVSSSGSSVVKSHRLSHLVWIGLIGGIAAAEIVAGAVLIGTSPEASGYRNPFGIASLCRGLLGLSDSQFHSELQAVNENMHLTMDVTTTGDPDRDFMQMMIPHHQGAIDMARVQLKYGRDEHVRRLAQSIIVEQNQEIAYMRQLIRPQSAQLSAN
jgi:hypothetical protein